MVVMMVRYCPLRTLMIWWMMMVEPLLEIGLLDGFLIMALEALTHDDDGAPIGDWSCRYTW